MSDQPEPMRVKRQEFIDYIRNTLIPDLHDSGRHSTASDFAAAMHFIEGASEVEIGEYDAEAVGTVPHPVRQLINEEKLFFRVFPDAVENLSIENMMTVPADSGMEDTSGEPLPEGSIVLIPH